MPFWLIQRLRLSYEVSKRRKTSRTEEIRLKILNIIYSFQVFPKERSSQSAAEAIDRNGIMYFGLMDPPSILCWNTATEFSSHNFHTVAADRETLQFASGVKIVLNARGEEELWVLTSSFQRIMTGSITSERINYRIHAEKVPIILANSPCKNSPNGQKGYHVNLVDKSSDGHTYRPHRYGSASYL